MLHPFVFKVAHRPDIQRNGNHPPYGVLFGMFLHNLEDIFRYRQFVHGNPFIVVPVFAGKRFRKSRFPFVLYNKENISILKPKRCIRIVEASEKGIIIYESGTGAARAHFVHTPGSAHLAVMTDPGKERVIGYNILTICLDEATFEITAGRTWPVLRCRNTPPKEKLRKGRLKNTEMISGKINIFLIMLFFRQWYPDRAAEANCFLK